MEAINKSLVTFSDVEVESYPYQHITIKEFFNLETSMKLLKWLENTSLFVKEHGDFYTQSMFPVSQKKLPDELKELLSEQTLLEIKRNSEKAFEVEFLDNIIITAHRLMEGQKTLIHNDYLEDPHNIKYGFTHRIVVYLNNNWDSSYGGQLGIYSSEKQEDLVRTIDPLHNTAVGFTFGKFSYHDINEVRKNGRFTLNFTLLSKK